MRIESSVTSLSWIPSEAVTGSNKAAFEAGFTHYDEPPPDVIDDIDALRDGDAFRFANHLRAYVEVDEDGTVADAGYSGGVVMGSTTVQVGKRHATFQAVALPDLRSDPVIDGGEVRFTQTVGGRTALPAPRRVNRPPFVQFRAPLVWTTLELTIGLDGSSSYRVVGASPFPRHWIYGADGRLEAKVGLASFKDWYRHAFGAHTPWGDEDHPSLVTAVETALERQLSDLIMNRGSRPEIRNLKQGALLAEEGQPGDELYLLLDGVLSVEVGGELLVELGPGAILGERAVLEHGLRTSTLRARTKCRIAVAAGADVDRELLAELAEGRRLEETASPPPDTP